MNCPSRLTMAGILILASNWVVSNGECSVVRVPDDRSTIQGAIDYAIDGDIILVSPGTYLDNLVFGGKRCVVRSAKGPESTILMPLLSGSPTVAFRDGEGEGAGIEGFKIVGNGANRESAVLCYESSPTIRGNWIREFQAPYGRAAGVHAEGQGANPKVVSNVFESNRGPAIAGISFGVLTIDKNRFLNGTADAGTAVHLEHGRGVLIRGSIAFGNTAFVHSTFYLNQITRVTVDHCTVDSNSSGNMGSFTFQSCQRVDFTNSIVSRELKGAGILFQGDGTIRAEFNDVWSAPSGLCIGFVPGQGHLSEDPLYFGGGEYRFAVTDDSPCVEAGNDELDIGAEHGGRYDAPQEAEGSPSSGAASPQAQESREGGVKSEEQMPVCVHYAKPAYPEMAREVGAKGTVWVQAFVLIDGTVKDARILKPSGQKVGFDEAAIAAAYQCKYKPAIQDGKPVAVWVSYKVDFKPEKK